MGVLMFPSGEECALGTEPKPKAKLCSGVDDCTNQQPRKGGVCIKHGAKVTKKRKLRTNMMDVQYMPTLEESVLIMGNAISLHCRGGTARNGIVCIQHDAWSKEEGV